MGIINQEISEVLSKSPFIALTSVSKGGQPHLIVVGKVKEIRADDIVVFGVYKIRKTRQNLSETGALQVAAVVDKKGFRLTGEASFTESEIVSQAKNADSLL